MKIDKSTLTMLSLVIGVVVGGGTVYGMARKYLPGTIIESVNIERKERIAADDSARVERKELRDQMSHLIHVVTLQTIIQMEPPGSEDRIEAARKLKKLRRYDLEREP